MRKHLFHSFHYLFSSFCIICLHPQPIYWAWMINESWDAIKGETPFTWNVWIYFSSHLINDDGVEGGGRGGNWKLTQFERNWPRIGWGSRTRRSHYEWMGHQMCPKPLQEAVEHRKWMAIHLQTHSPVWMDARSTQLRIKNCTNMSWNSVLNVKWPNEFEGPPQLHPRWLRLMNQIWLSGGGRIESNPYTHYLLWGRFPGGERIQVIQLTTKSCLKKVWWLGEKSVKKIKPEDDDCRDFEPKF